MRKPVRKPRYIVVSFYEPTDDWQTNIERSEYVADLNEKIDKQVKMQRRGKSQV